MFMWGAPRYSTRYFQDKVELKLGLPKFNTNQDNHKCKTGMWLTDSNTVKCPKQESFVPDVH